MAATKPTVKAPAVTTGTGPAISYTPTTVGMTGPLGAGTIGKTRIPTYTSEYVAPDITSTQFLTNQVYQRLGTPESPAIQSDTHWRVPARQGTSLGTYPPA